MSRASRAKKLARRLGGGFYRLLPIALLLPLVMFYARSVSSDVFEAQRASLRRAPLASRIAGATRVVHGHTHREGCAEVSGVDVWNPGS